MHVRYLATVSGQGGICTVSTKVVLILARHHEDADSDSAVSGGDLCEGSEPHRRFQCGTALHWRRRLDLHQLGGLLLRVLSAPLATCAGPPQPLHCRAGWGC